MSLLPVLQRIIVAAAIGAAIGAVLAIVANVPGEFASAAAAVGAAAVERLREEASRRGIKLPF